MLQASCRSCSHPVNLLQACLRPNLHETAAENCQRSSLLLFVRVFSIFPYFEMHMCSKIFLERTYCRSCMHFVFIYSEMFYASHGLEHCPDLMWQFLLPVWFPLYPVIEICGREDYLGRKELEKTLLKPLVWSSCILKSWFLGSFRNACQCFWARSWVRGMHQTAFSHNIQNAKNQTKILPDKSCGLCQERKLNARWMIQSKMAL